ncbi:SAF domain-containing protein [Paenibacillus oenotherae]|uniref:SAF domain-containing protein n=1 Tax=Paenibacillus oenotherae TaxID=1435645 RepID=A0ABS7D5J2_9BACL|nr:SAF domain-containing protein [Paenibacillus oenotherae]MBW7475207.1 SAF domain-containing protein [Paenibacillus oenotherae]
MSYRYYNAKLIDERAAYEEQLAEKNEVLKRYQDQSRTAYILAAPKAAGEVITASDVREEMLPEFASPENVIRNKKELVGKYLKINAEPGTAITMEMIREEEKLDPSERIEETEYIKLPLRGKKSDVVDIRIVFPNGEDYIVIAKKTLKDIEIDNQYAFFNDSEEEAQMLQSALVDAYINNAELYMKQYVEPEMQPRPIPTYSPNVDVLRVMKSNPLIVDQAKWALAEKIRLELDKRMESLDPDRKIRVGADAPVGSGVSKRKLPSGATTVTQPEGNQSVNQIVDQPTNQYNTNPEVLQPDGNEFEPQVEYNVEMPVPDSKQYDMPIDSDSDLLGGQ